MANVDNIKVFVVDVGQGQLTYIECYEGLTLEHTILMDAGSKNKSDFTEANASWIGARIGSMKPTPTVDLISLSHPDKDHTNLVTTILSASGNKTKVGKVVYSGYEEKYEGLIATLKNEYNATTYTVGPDYSDWDKKNGKWLDPFWDDVPGLQFYILKANTMTEVPPEETVEPGSKRGRAPENKNQGSLIAMLKFTIDGKETNFITCGDATTVSFSSVTVTFSGIKLNNVNMVTVPHHGSRSTALKLKRSKGDVTHEDLVLSAFSNILNGQTTTVSAFNKYSHPYVGILNFFTPVLKTPLLEDTRIEGVNKRHLLVGMNDVGLEIDDKALLPVYLTLASTSNLFGTWYALDGLPAQCSYVFNRSGVNIAEKGPENLVKDQHMANHACWIYSVDNKAAISVSGKVELKSDTIFTRELKELDFARVAVAEEVPVMLRSRSVEVKSPMPRTLSKTSLFH